MDSKTAAALAARTQGVRAGVDVGFADAAFSRALRQAHAGVWMTVEDGGGARTAAAAALDPKTVLQLGTGGELPFEDHQFEVVLLAATLFAQPRERLETLIREAHRILQGGGCLYFTVEDEAAGNAGWTQRAVYELLRDGFDVVGLKRPSWWKFGTAGRTLTVCARRKNWRNRGTPIVGAALPVSSAMLSPRERSK
ncbi:MAG: methyltransferase domain-containing protein [Kiritimatiellae bacterium]|nr:methyltransferase domain-containing protein [Kiritimatiellia bacterium]